MAKPKPRTPQGKSDEQLQANLSLVFRQVRRRIRESNNTRRYVLTASLLRAASKALGGAYEDKAGDEAWSILRAKSILKAISIPVEHPAAFGPDTEQAEKELIRAAEKGNLVSVYPIDKQEEARRLGHLVALELDHVPNGDLSNDLLETNQHKRGVAAMVLRAIQSRFNVSSHWRANLPTDWNSPENQVKAFDSIVTALGKMPHRQWPTNAGKVIRAYLRAIGADPGRFKATDS
jgi:hypothetical protein